MHQRLILPFSSVGTKGGSLAFTPTCVLSIVFFLQPIHVFLARISPTTNDILHVNRERDAHALLFGSGNVEVRNSAGYIPTPTPRGRTCCILNPGATLSSTHN